MYATLIPSEPRQPAAANPRAKTFHHLQRSDTASGGSLATARACAQHARWLHTRAGGRGWIWYRFWLVLRRVFVSHRLARSHIVDGVLIERTAERRRGGKKAKTKNHRLFFLLSRQEVMSRAIDTIFRFNDFVGGPPLKLVKNLPHNCDLSSSFIIRGNRLICV